MAIGTFSQFYRTKTDLQDKNGNTSLHIAVQNPDCLGNTCLQALYVLEIVKLLVRNKANKNIRNTAGFYPEDIVLVSEKFALNPDNQHKYRAILNFLQRSDRISQNQENKKTKIDFKALVTNKLM